MKFVKKSFLVVATVVLILSSKKTICMEQGGINEGLVNVWIDKPGIIVEGIKIAQKDQNNNPMFFSIGDHIVSFDSFNKTVMFVYKSEFVSFSFEAIMDIMSLSNEEDNSLRRSDNLS